MESRAKLISWIKENFKTRTEMITSHGSVYRGLKNNHPDIIKEAFPPDRVEKRKGEFLKTMCSLFEQKHYMTIEDAEIEYTEYLTPQGKYFSLDLLEKLKNIRPDWYDINFKIEHELDLEWEEIVEKRGERHGGLLGESRIREIQKILKGPDCKTKAMYLKKIEKMNNIDRNILLLPWELFASWVSFGQSFSHKHFGLIFANQMWRGWSEKHLFISKDRGIFEDTPRNVLGEYDYQKIKKLGKISIKNTKNGDVYSHPSSYFGSSRDSSQYYKIISGVVPESRYFFKPSENQHWAYCGEDGNIIK